jgi:hypothetical protein
MQQCAPSLGQLDAVRPAVEQLHPEFLLERLICWLNGACPG